MSYLKRAATAASTRQTPQSKPIPGTSQVENSAGGFAWQIDSLDRLRRFLILGSEGGSYYATETKLTEENALAVRDALDEHGAVAVAEIIAISHEGRAPKNDPAIFALAMAAGHTNADVRAAALAGVPVVCRIGTHLFHFADYVERFRGWGRGLRKAVGRWYEREDLSTLAYQAIKYRQRDGYTHRDLLRLSHPDAPTDAHKALYDWICRGAADEGVMARFREIFGHPSMTDVQPDEAATANPPTADRDHPLRMVEGYERAQHAINAKWTARYVSEYGLPREALLTEHLNEPVVWEAMLERGMPITALFRNLATLTRNGVLAPMNEWTRKVAEQITDGERLRKGRVHPLAVLAALLTYQSGRGFRGTMTWDPVREIVDALDAAFYASFRAVEPTNKKTMLALDVSGSMFGNPVAGIPGLHAAMGAAAMSLVTANVEPAYMTVGFTSGGGSVGQGWASSSGGGRYGMRHDGITPLPISPRQRLDDVMRVINDLPFGGTDCALPMLFAEAQGIDIDTFIVYTDNETWAGGIHPAQALVRYREKAGHDARLIVVGMCSNGFTIADPNDRGMLDVVGFDTTAPNVISEFSAGRI